MFCIPNLIGLLNVAENLGSHQFLLFFRDDILEKMKSRYLDNPEYNYEKVNRASQACGPMVKWAIAQVREKHGPAGFEFHTVVAYSGVCDCFLYPLALFFYRLAIPRCFIK